MAIEHTFLHKDNSTKTKRLTPISAIRERCLECSNWSHNEVRDCPVVNCALYPFRMGAAHNRNTP